VKLLSRCLIFDVRCSGKNEHQTSKIKHRISKQKMAKQQQQEEENQINVELSEEMAEGEYVNLAMIAHSQSEFVIDFIKMMPGIPKARVKSRVILTPDHVYRLMQALKENIQRYEEAYGAITDEQSQIGFQFPMNYRGPIGEA
jgi:Protein of unknown function (DUF3467)